MKHLLSIKKPFKAVLLSPVSCTGELKLFDLFVFHGKICGAPPKPTPYEAQACSQQLMFSSVRPGGCPLSVLRSDYSWEWLVEGGVGECNFRGLLKLNTPHLTKPKRPFSLNRHLEPGEGTPKAKSLMCTGKLETESRAKPGKYSKKTNKVSHKH